MLYNAGQNYMFVSFSFVVAVKIGFFFIELCIKNIKNIIEIHMFISQITQ